MLRMGQLGVAGRSWAFTGMSVGTGVIWDRLFSPQFPGREVGLYLHCKVSVGLSELLLVYISAPKQTLHRVRVPE